MDYFHQFSFAFHILSNLNKFHRIKGDQFRQENNEQSYGGYLKLYLHLRIVGLQSVLSVYKHLSCFWNLKIQFDHIFWFFYDLKDVRIKIHKQHSRWSLWVSQQNRYLQVYKEKRYISFI